MDFIQLLSRSESLRCLIKIPGFKTFPLVIFTGLIIFQFSSAEEVVHYPIPSDSCSMYDTCSERDFFRTCSCEEDCHRYGTCCWDVPNRSTETIEEETFLCFNDKILLPVYTKKVCSSSFQGEPIVKTLCESLSPNATDLMSQVLVSSNKTWTTYFNWNCAICNNENATDLVFWTVQATCTKPNGGKRVEADKVRREIKFHEDLDQWGVRRDEEFLACPLTFFQPALLMGHLRYCAPDMVANCPEDWHDYRTRHNCISHYAERKDKKTGVYYKNVYCAMCNGLNPSALDCLGRNYRPVMNSADLGAMKVVFNLNPWSGEYSKGEQFLCTEGRTYDPFLKICRSTNCGLINPEDDVEFCKTSGSNIRSMIRNSCLVASVLLVLVMYVS